MADFDLKLTPGGSCRDLTELDETMRLNDTNDDVTFSVQGDMGSGIGTLTPREAKNPGGGDVVAPPAAGHGEGLRGRRQRRGAVVGHGNASLDLFIYITGKSVPYTFYFRCTWLPCDRGFGGAPRHRHCGRRSEVCSEPRTTTTPTTMIDDDRAT